MVTGVRSEQVMAVYEKAFELDPGCRISMLYASFGEFKGQRQSADEFLALTTGQDNQRGG